MENKWLSKLKHNHPLFLSHTAYCKRTANVQRSHDSGEHDVSLDEEQRSNENVLLLNVKKVSVCTKERRQTYRNMGKKRVFVYAFISALFHKENVYPFTNTLNNWIVFNLEDQKCNRQRDSSGRARLHVWDHKYKEWRDTKRKKRSQITTALPNVTLQYQYIFKCNKDKYMFKMHLQLCRIKEDFLTAGLLFLSNQMLKNVRRQTSEEHFNGV